MRTKSTGKVLTSPQSEIVPAGGEVLSRGMVAVSELPQEMGRLVHHRCGYPLLVGVGQRLEWAGMVVVKYRDGYKGGDSLLLYHCPRCGGELKLWWHDHQQQQDESQHR